MSPNRYLMLRRMHLVRRALSATAPEAATVTQLATRYGFLALGRSAGEYRALFGGDARRHPAAASREGGLLA